MTGITSVAETSRTTGVYACLLSASAFAADAFFFLSATLTWTCFFVSLMLWLTELKNWRVEFAT